MFSCSPSPLDRHHFVWSLPMALADFRIHERWKLEGALLGFELDVARLGLTLAGSHGELFRGGEAVPDDTEAFEGIARVILAPVAAVGALLLILVGTTPAIAEPLRPWSGGGLDPGSGASVSGAGGFSDEMPIALPTGASVSVLKPTASSHDRERRCYNEQFGIAAALESTRRGRRSRKWLYRAGI